jgi:hypothetical protein
VTQPQRSGHIIVGLDRSGHDDAVLARAGARPPHRRRSCRHAHPRHGDRHGLDRRRNKPCRSPPSGRRKPRPRICRHLTTNTDHLAITSQSTTRAAQRPRHRTARRRLAPTSSSSAPGRRPPIPFCSAPSAKTSRSATCPVRCTRNLTTLLATVAAGTAGFAAATATSPTRASPRVDRPEAAVRILRHPMVAVTTVRSASQVTGDPANACPIPARPGGRTPRWSASR